ncbi:MAG TPA: glycosyltransferase [Patescibacteria group bacterium]|nr:glycosyltransferase [Patescibacteria group bacterium]
MKIALVHDQLQEFGGAERVLVALKEIFPEAPVFTSLYIPQRLGIHRKKVEKWKIIASWFDKIPLIKNMYSPLRFLTPLIWESFDFTGYDLVISSSGSYMSKGIITRPPTVHISYLHHPPRYLYYYETAVEWQKHLPIKIYGHIINHNLRAWDYLSSKRVDHFIANSFETKARIKKFYRRDSEVIYPPVTIQSTIQQSTPIGSGSISNNQQSYYITVSRLARAKHVDILIKAANTEKFHLKIVGAGRDEQYLRSIAGSTVEFVGEVKDSKRDHLYQNARAFLFASVDEEFGIAPVEAMGYGVPVIAYKSGGLKETVKEGVNGFLFDELNSDSLVSKIRTLESLSKEEYEQMRKQARMRAKDFSQEEFKKNILAYINTIRSV